MKKTCLILICLILLIPISGGNAQTFLSDEIRIAIPHTVITNMIKAALPLNLEKGPYLKGRLWIHAVDNLKIDFNKVTFDLDIRGENIKLETHLGNQALLMDIGNFNAAFSCNASLHYDPAKRMLYITPYILQKPNKNKVNALADNLLKALPLINGVDYPIDIPKIQPVITQISSEQFNIDMEITNIHTENDTVFINGWPRFKKIMPSPPE